MLLTTIFQILMLLLQVATWIIIAQAILSWLVAFNVINTHNDFVRQTLYALSRLTEPLYRPVRRILPDFGTMDFAPFVVLITISILQNIVMPAIYRATAATFI